jgi:hypothetical protein
MRPTTALFSGLVATTLVFMPLSSASAHERHYHGLIGGLFGVAGDIVVGAATIAAAPFYVIAGATSGHGYDDRRDNGYYGRRPQSYGPRGSGYYQGYDGPRSEYYGPDAYDHDRYPRADYRPPRDRYEGSSENYPLSPRGYYPTRGYVRDYSNREDNYSVRDTGEREGPDRNFENAPYDAPDDTSYRGGATNDDE